MNLIVQFIHHTLPLKSNELVRFVPATTSAFIVSRHVCRESRANSSINSISTGRFGFDCFECFNASVQANGEERVTKQICVNKDGE